MDPTTTIEGRKRFLDPNISSGAPPQTKISKEERHPTQYVNLQSPYFMNQVQFEQFMSQNWNGQLQDPHFLLQNSIPQHQFFDSHAPHQQLSVTNFQEQFEAWSSLNYRLQGPSEPYNQNPQHSPQLSLLSQLQIHLQIPLQFLSTHHDSFAIPRLVQIRLLMKPHHLPDPENITSLDGLVGFNRTQIRKIILGYVAVEDQKEVLKVLEEYRELHSKRINLVKGAEFPESFIVKLYYKYHEIVAKSFKIPPNDTDSYQKWMLANINYHVGFRKIGQELQKNNSATSLSEITCFKMERMEEIRQHKTELDPTFLDGFEEVQKEFLESSRQLPVEQSRNILPDWAHLPNNSGGEHLGVSNLDPGALGTQWLPEEPTTSATYFDNFGSNPWALEHRIEGNGSSENDLKDDEDSIQDNDGDSPSLASPEAIITPERPEERIESSANSTPVSKSSTPSPSLEDTKENKLAKLTALLNSLIENTTKLNLLKTQKPIILEKIEKQEEILKEIGRERKEQKERLLELKKLKEEQEKMVNAAKVEMEVAEKNYQEEVEKSKEFYKSILTPEFSANILSDASDCIDSMDEETYNTFLLYTNSRRTLNSTLKIKQDTLNNAKNDFLESENKIIETKKKLEEFRENEEKEIEKMREEEELLEDIEEEMKDLENEKVKLEKHRNEQEGKMELAERDLVLTESKPDISDFIKEEPASSPENFEPQAFDIADEKPISQTSSPENPPELHNEEATADFSSMFDSWDSAPVLSPHYPSSSPSLSSPSPSPPNENFAGLNSDLLSGLGLLPIGQSIDSEGNILNAEGQVIGNCSLDFKLFIPSGALSSGGQ